MQEVEGRRNRLEREDARALAHLVGKEREETEVRAYIENAVAVVVSDAMSRINLVFKNLAVNGAGLRTAVMSNRHPVRQGIAWPFAQQRFGFGNHLPRRKFRARSVGRYQISNQGWLAGFRRAGHDRSLAHSRMLCQHRFNLAQLYPVAPQLYLIVRA